MASMNQIATRVHKTASEHGFWPDIPANVEALRFGTLMALVHSEASEALEAYRENGLNAWVTRTYAPTGGAESTTTDKPEGVPIELADIIIRVFDVCAAYGIDIDLAVAKKMDYNESRAYQHGGKAF